MADYTSKALKLSKNGNTYTINQGIPFGTCSTAIGSREKAVTVDFFPGLFKGATVNVVFSKGNNNTSPTLNVNSTGAKPIYKYGTSVAGVDTVLWRANEVYTFTYNGTGWLVNNYLNVTPANIGAVASLQGTSNTGKFLAVNSSGAVAPTDLPEDESYLLEVDCGIVTSNSTRTITNSSVTSDMVVVSYNMGNDNAFATPISVETSDGSLSLDTTIIGSETSTLVLYLMRKRTT